MGTSAEDMVGEVQKARGKELPMAHILRGGNGGARSPHIRHTRRVIEATVRLATCLRPRSEGNFGLRSVKSHLWSLAIAPSSKILGSELPCPCT